MDQASLDAAISSVTGVPAEAPVANLATTEPAATVDAAEPPPPVDTPPAPVAPTAQSDAERSAFQAIARKELELRNQYASRLADLKRREAELSAKPAPRQISEDEFRAQLDQDPIGTLERMGYTGPRLNDLAKAAWGKNMGADAPREIREQQNLAPLRQQISELTRMFTEERSARQKAENDYQQMQTMQAKRSAMAAEVSKIPDTLKFVKATAAVRPDMVQDQLMAMADRYEQAYGERPSAVQLAELLEQDYARDLEPLIQHLNKTNAPTPTQVTAPGKTLTNEMTTKTAPRTAPKTEDELLDELVEDLKSGKHLQ